MALDYLQYETVLCRNKVFLYELLASSRGISIHTNVLVTVVGAAVNAGKEAHGDEDVSKENTLCVVELRIQSIKCKLSGVIVDCTIKVGAVDTS